MFKIYFPITLFVLSLALFSCSGSARKDYSAFDSQIVPGYKAEGKELVVFPFIRSEGISDIADYEGTGRERIIQPDLFIPRAVHKKLSQAPGSAELVPFTAGVEGLGNVLGGSPGLDYKAAALSACRGLEANLAIIGKVSNFREREGGESGVSSPASVVFHVELLECRNGAIIWRDSFAETQRPLLSNILELKKFLKRKAKWITAKELAEEGVGRIVARLNQYLEII